MKNKKKVSLLTLTCILLSSSTKSTSTMSSRWPVATKVWTWRRSVTHISTIMPYMRSVCWTHMLSVRPWRIMRPVIRQRPVIPVVKTMPTYIIRIIIPTIIYIIRQRTFIVIRCAITHNNIYINIIRTISICRCNTRTEWK